MKKQRLRRLLPILLLLAALILPASGLASEIGNDVTAYLSGLSASVTQNGVAVPEGGTLTNDPVSVRFSFGVPVLGDEPVPANPIRKGDHAEFELSSGFSLESDSEYVLRSGDVIVGHVKIITEVGSDGVKRVKARVDFDGDEDVYNGELNAVSAFFTADFNYDGGESGGGSGEDTVSILEKDYTVIIPPGEINYRVNKSGVVNLEEGTITWTATVDAVQNGAHINLGGYIFEDDLSGAGAYIPGTFVVGSGSQTPTYAEDKLTYTFPSGTEGPKTITYKTQIPADKYYAQGEQTAANRAALKNPGGQEVKFDKATVAFEPGWITKSGASNETSGVYNPTNRTITWTILVSNVGSTAMENVQITDTLPAGLEWQSATIQIDGGAITEINSEPSGGIYNIAALNNNAVLKITAKVPDEAYTAGITTYTNSASVTWDGYKGSGDGIGSGDVGVGIGFVPITKSGTADTKTGLVTWTVTVDTRGQAIPGLKVYDLLVHGDDTTSLPPTLPGGIAPSALTPQFNQRYEDWGSGSAGLSYNVIPVMIGETRVADLIEVTGLAINAVNTFTFTSRILDPNILAGNGRTDVRNTATLYSNATRLNAATATVDYKGTSLKKSMLSRDKAVSDSIDPNGVTSNLAEGFNYQDKTVVFRLSVNVNGMDLTKLKNADGKESGTITITDTLPDGWVYTDVTAGNPYLIYKGESVTSSGVILVGDPPESAAPTTGSASGSTATFTFDDLSDRYVILLRATPTSDKAAELFNDNKTTIVNNTVTMTAENWSDFDPSSTQRVSVESKVAGKSASVHPTEGTVTWTLDYRPYDIAHLESSPAHIIDTIPAGVELRTNEAGVLYTDGITAHELILKPDGTYELGNPVTLTLGGNLSYNNTTRELKFNISNPATGYRFTYITDITGEPGTRVTNTATLHGKSKEGTNVSDSFVISQSDSGATVGRGGRLSIDKRGGLGQPLPGVFFTLYGYDLLTGNPTIPIRVGATDSSGKLNMRVIPVGDYILKETMIFETPDGYHTLDPTTYAVKVVNDNGTIITTIDGESAEAALLIRNLTNENNRTNISATKTWMGGFVRDYEAVELTLYANGVAIDNDIIKPTITPDGDGASEYTYTWADLPEKDKGGNPITYTVDEETTPSGYVKDSIPDLNVTNAYKVTAEKTWVDGRYAAKPELWLQLYRHTTVNPTPVAVPATDPGGTPLKLDPPSYSGSETSKTLEATWLGVDAEFVAEDGTKHPYTFTVKEGTYEEVEGVWVFTAFSDQDPDPMAAAHFTADFDGTSVTNTYKSPTTAQAAATKTWLGYQATRPDVWFRLQRRVKSSSDWTNPSPNPWAQVPVPVGQTNPYKLNQPSSQDPSDPETWKSEVTWTGLENTDEQGREYEFRVLEVNEANNNINFVPEGYTKTESGLGVTNRYTVSATKTWEDGRYADKPALWLKLYRQIEGGTLEEVPVDEPGGTPGLLPAPSYSDSETSKIVEVEWRGVNAEDENGNPYTFTVKEGSYIDGVFTEFAPENFTPTHNGTGITNQYVIPADAEVSVYKEWQDFTPAGRPRVGFRLYREAKNPEGPGMIGDPTAVADIKELPNQAPRLVKWTGLERTDDQGREYVFTVKEGVFDAENIFTEGMPAYYRVTPVVVLDTEKETTIVVTNTYKASGTLALSGEKTFSGRDATNNDVFEFKLYKNSVAEANLLQTKTVTGNGSLTFDAITYHLDLQANPVLNDLGNHTYVVVETVPVTNPSSGITYDSTQYTVTVTVTDNGDGTLDVDVTSENATSLDFTNTYAATGSLALSGSKTLSGRDLAADEFTFEVYEGTEATGAPIRTIKNVAAAADVAAPFSFPVINYTLDDVGNKTYSVVEQSGSLGGVTYATNSYTVTVEISDKGDGSLDVDVTSDNATSLDFTNTYAATGSLTLSGSKTLTRRDLAADEFTFEVYEGTEATGTPIRTVKSTAAAADVAAPFSFPVINYTLDDVLTSPKTYTVVEQSGSLGGVTYATNSYTVTVEISDKGDGSLDVDVTSDNATSLDFTNTYAASGIWDPQVTKALDAGGRTLKAEEFSFTLTGEDQNQTKQNSATGSVIFDAIDYNEKDIGSTYTYTIEETAGSETGMSYSDLLITAVVTISDNGDGTLDVQAAYFDENEDPEHENPLGLEALVFTNTYKATGSVALRTAKSLDLEAGSRRVTAGEFSFSLYAGTDTTVDPIDTKANDAAGLVTFDTLDYDQEDIGQTFTYTILEAENTENGMVSDLTPRVISVRVTDAGNGQLNVAPAYPSDNLFKNRYEAQAELALEAAKSLDLGAGSRVVQAGEFSFSLYQGIGATGDALETASNDADGKVTFAPIPYTAQDIGRTYTYTIVEVAGTEEGMTYDAAPLYVQVDITDLGKGELAVAPRYVGAEAFVNSYEAQGEALVQVTKALDGRALKAGDFSFSLYAGEDLTAEPMQTVSNLADGAVAFAPIPYDQTDIGKTFTYTIVELPGTEEGMSYDPMEITVTVTVEDEGGSVLAALPVYPEDIVFNNAYVAQGEALLQVTKALDGRALEAEAFTFNLYLDEAEERTLIQTATNAEDGTVAFAPIPYDQEDIGKTFTYTIVELPGTEEGMRYDPMEITVSVTVEDEGGGVLIAVPVYPEDAVFNNAYTAQGEALLQVRKVLSGRAASQGEFSFRLYEGTGTQGALLQTKTNASDGAVAFDPLPFTQDDIGESYDYTIVEVPGSEAGMRYDEKELRVTITVSDLGNGVLQVDVAYQGDPQFSNLYVQPTPTPRPDYQAISVPVSARKNLSGRQMSPGEFTFILKDGAGNALDQASNDSAGNVTFESRRFSRTGVFLYTIQEVPGNSKEIKYDPTVYTLRVETSASGGELQANVSYLKDGVPFAGDIAFHNTYALPQTGDSQPQVMMILAAAALLTLMLGIRLRKKREN